MKLSPQVPGTPGSHFYSGVWLPQEGSDKVWGSALNSSKLCRRLLFPLWATPFSGAMSVGPLEADPEVKLGV